VTDTTTWLQLVYLALFCSVFASLAQTWAVQRTSASRASLLLGTEPIWAVAIGISLGSEHLTVPAAIGALLLLAGTTWGQSIERTAAHDDVNRSRALRTGPLLVVGAAIRASVDGDTVVGPDHGEAESGSGDTGDRLVGVELPGLIGGTGAGLDGD